MQDLCVFCDQVVTDSETAWKEVRGFVGGKKKDSMVLRIDTGRQAHDHCVAKARQGQAPDQLELFDESAQEKTAPPPNTDWLEDGKA